MENTHDLTFRCFKIILLACSIPLFQIKTSKSNHAQVLTDAEFAFCLSFFMSKYSSRQSFGGT